MLEVVTATNIGECSECGQKCRACQAMKEAEDYEKWLIGRTRYKFYVINRDPNADWSSNKQLEHMLLEGELEQTIDQLKKSSPGKNIYVYRWIEEDKRTVPEGHFVFPVAWQYLEKIAVEDKDDH